jgi:predicted RNase H-like HicB family nuclease
MRKYYYGVFTKTDEAVEVEIPDVQGAVTFGDNFEEAYDMAVDALAAVLTHSEPQFIKNKASTFEEIKKDYNAENQIIFPVPVDVLKRIDETRGKLGERDRSKFITEGMKEYTRKFAEQTS